MSFIQADKTSFSSVPIMKTPMVGGSPIFWKVKRAFDIGFSLLLLVPFLFCAVVLCILNPFWNKGALFYRQTRMGQDCKPFTAIKFRSMREEKVTRGADEPIEAHRITTLGHFLRRSRFDELPQILNVLRGSMSLIGPRPDYFIHAKAYLRQIPEYRARHVVRPGISGLAQVDVGYVESFEGTRAKVDADLRYICEAGFAMDASVFWKTLMTVAGRKGS